MRVSDRFPVGSFLVVAMLAVPALAVSCAHLFGTLPSSASVEGVAFTIHRQECRPNSETSDPRQTADLVIDLEINNPSSTPLIVRTGAMQVVDTEGGSMTRRGWGQAGPLQVAPGGNESVTMHFLGSQEHCCSSRLSLNPSQATLGEHTVAVAPINFVPSCLF